MEKQWLFWFEEIGAEDSDLVGKKCANLGELTRIGLNVPPGFSLSLEAYNKFLSETNLEQELREYLEKYLTKPQSISQWTTISNEIRQIVESKGIPEDMSEAIMSNYSELSHKCGVPDIEVSVRSAGAVSHPGQYETYLNVKGMSDLLEKIIKVWSSSFNPRSLAYRARQGLPLQSDPIGVCILSMVNARTAGVALTADPNTGDRSKIICEANWGLGESVVSGSVTPDLFVLDKESLKILEKKIGSKEKRISFREKGVIEEDISPDKRACFCLDDEEAKQIARFGQVIEKHFQGIPQDIEWAITDKLLNGNSIFFLQTRPAIISERKSATDTILDFMFSRGF